MRFGVTADLDGNALLGAVGWGIEAPIPEENREGVLSGLLKYPCCCLSGMIYER